MPTIAIIPAKTLQLSAARAAVREAKENFLYWRRKAAISVKPLDQEDAAARRDAWKSTLAARQSTLEKLEA